VEAVGADALSCRVSCCDALVGNEQQLDLMAAEEGQVAKNDEGDSVCGAKVTGAQELGLLSADGEYKK
jgi:hypothetical protein